MKLLRINSWWNTIVPQVLGWIYFSMLTFAFLVPQHNYFNLYVGACATRCVVFFVSLVGIAAFGYLFNDLCDIESDSLASKTNQLAQFKVPTRIMVVAIPFLVGIGAWGLVMYQSYLMAFPVTIPCILFTAQLLALILYSLKPFRAKDRAALGVIFDAFYGHFNPIMITLFVFVVYPEWGDWYYCFMAVLGIVCFIKGIRNIMLHQIEDRKKDQQAGSNTAVIKYGPWRVINFINHFLFPAEIFFLVCLMLVISVHIPPFIIPLILFAVFSYLKMSGWKIGYADRRLLEFKFSYFMNDFYENWLPVFTLIILSVYRHEFVFLLILHLILFPGFVMKLVKDLKTIRENFKTEEDY